MIKSLSCNPTVGIASRIIFSLKGFIMVSHDERWLPARNLWDDGHPISYIAKIYGLSEKAVRTRIKKWRKEKGWFPKRD